jgi:hypothetical protein
MMNANRTLSHSKRGRGDSAAMQASKKRARMRRYLRRCLAQVVSEDSATDTKSVSAYTRRIARIKLRRKLSSIRRTLRHPFTPKQQQRFGTDYLRMLPPELRTMVYEYVLAFEHPIEAQRRPDDSLRSRSAKAKNVNILLACWLTYAEALPILYQQNTILIDRVDLCSSQGVVKPHIDMKLVSQQSMILINVEHANNDAVDPSLSAAWRSNLCYVHLAHAVTAKTLWKAFSRPSAACHD